MKRIPKNKIIFVVWRFERDSKNTAWDEPSVAITPFNFHEKEENAQAEMKLGNEGHKKKKLVGFSYNKFTFGNLKEDYPDIAQMVQEMGFDSENEVNPGKKTKAPKKKFSSKEDDVDDDADIDMDDDPDDPDEEGGDEE